MTDSERDTDVLLLLMTVVPQWEEVERVRTAVHACLVAPYDVEIADAVSMAAAELAENGVKYGTGGDVIIALRELPGAVEVSVTNDTLASGSLEAKVAWIRERESPEEAYRQALEGVVLAGIVQSGGLGLVRIVYEGGCELAVDQQGGRVTVRAKRTVPLRGVA